MPQSPHIVLIVADNLGWGELGCYGGGALRGAPTPNIDRLATEGLLLQNFNVESDCVPTRSARIEALRGVGSLCEAAALACAGPGSRLALTRIASGSVTCALAFRPETRQRTEG